jgi:hypothetical protein
MLRSRSGEVPASRRHLGFVGVYACVSQDLQIAQRISRGQHSDLLVFIQKKIIIVFSEIMAYDLCTAKNLVAYHLDLPCVTD